MTHRIDVDFEPAEGALLRMIGLVERRGFQLRGLQMAEKDGRGLLSLEVQPRDPSRRLEVVAAQLRRLHDVGQVSVSTQGY